jgi:hypothetical protein
MTNISHTGGGVAIDLREPLNGTKTFDAGQHLVESDAVDAGPFTVEWQMARPEQQPGPLQTGGILDPTAVRGRTMLEPSCHRL